MHLETPVLFLVFNRPSTTQRVFEQIRKARPQKLYVASDGPRPGRADDIVANREVKEIIDNGIDWPCEVKRLYRQENLGCRGAVSSAIDWFFKHVEEGIILEDDCLPSGSFFTFCEALLEKYRNDEKVMHIGGTNFQEGRTWGDGSYYFSRISHVWGWASWRRAWKHYDVEMKALPQFLKARLESISSDTRLQAHWRWHFKKVYNGANTWDYQWNFAIMNNQGVCLIPNVNMVSNIGFGQGAANAADTDSKVANMKAIEIGEIKHPQDKSVQHEADAYTLLQAFPKPTFFKRVKRKLKKLIYA